MPQHAGDSLPDALFTADSVRRIDQYVIDQLGVDGFDLMQSAARAAFRRLALRWSGIEPVLVLCGAGNNGGDGYLVAANALRHGLTVHCIAVAPTEKLSGDARKAWQKAIADGVEVRELVDIGESGLESLIENTGVIVDAMLGTGVSGAPRAPFANVIARCNHSKTPVLAVDVPSGLNATTGAAKGEVMQASMTVTFIGRKAGLHTGLGTAVCGDIAFEPLDTAIKAGDIGEGAETGESPIAMLQSWASIQGWLPRRPANAHKGRFGHVLVVAGDRGFGGAGLLAAEAAARSGAGLVSLATRPEHVTAALARCPSMMVHGLTHGSELPSLLDAATVVVCGPGMGQSAWGQQMLQRVVESGKPRVLDADALNLLSSRVAVPANNQILTPHPGEAARLLNCLVPEIEADRLAAANKLQSLYGGVVLLKGAGTIVSAGETTVDIAGGSNPGMATGGMGDVLSGIVGALYAQVIESPARAATIGAVVHLEAANRASVEKGYMGLIATDVIDALPHVFQEAELVASRREEEE